MNSGGRFFLVFPLFLIILQKNEKNGKKGLTSLTSGAKIVNCIIIAYRALFAPEKDVVFYLYGEKSCKKSDERPQTNFLNGVIEFMINVRDQKLGQNLRKSFNLCFA